MTGDISMAEKARAAWGEVPDWIEELAALVDRDGLNRAGERIGYSASAISTTIRNRYQGDLARVEAKVRGALMGETVVCPVLGEIGRDRCLDWQKKPFAPTSAVRVQVFHACRSKCRHSRLKGETT